MTIPAGFGQISVEHSGGGIVGSAFWTLGFDNNASDTAADIADYINTTLIGGDYLDCLSSSVFFVGVHVKLGPDATGPSAFEANGNNGTVGGNAAPPNIAGLVHKNTSLGGRQGRGRLFVPGLAEAFLAQDGLITSEYSGLLQTLFTGLGGSMILNSLPPMLLHADALSPTAIDTLTVDPMVATQRRRLRR